MKYKKYVQKHFWKKHLRALQVSLCALVTWPVCPCSPSQLRGNIVWVFRKLLFNQPRLK